MVLCPFVGFVVFFQSEKMSYVLVTRDSESRGDICSDALLHRETQKMRADTIIVVQNTEQQNIPVQHGTWPQNFRYL
jgi:hypothetical protein